MNAYTAYTAAAYDHPAVRRSFRAIKDPSPLLAAMLEWYDELNDEDQYEVEQTVMNIIFRMKSVVLNSFGPSQALELLGCLIAVECEWIKPDGTPLPHRTRVLSPENVRLGR